MHMLMNNHCTPTNMSSYRYHAVQLLMAQSQMRRGSHDEALSHWSELLSKAESSREKASVYQNIAECCIQLGMENIDWIVYFLVRYHSTIHWRERCNTVLNYLLHWKEQTTMAILRLRTGATTEFYNRLDRNNVFFSIKPAPKSWGMIICLIHSPRDLSNNLISIYWSKDWRVKLLRIKKLLPPGAVSPLFLFQLL